MQIAPDTKIAEILRHRPEALEVIAALHPRFANLRNPLLRKVMAPRVTLAQAAGVGGCTVHDFYRVLAPLGFEAPATVDPGVQRSEALPPQLPQPHWLSYRPVHYLDVRPTLEAGRDPLPDILKELRRIGHGEVLAVVNSFEPLPLIKLLGRKGYESHLEHASDGSVVTYFFIAQAPAEAEPEAPVPVETGEPEFDALVAGFGERLQVLDVRHLEMPQPMLSILEALEQLPADAALFVHHKRVPVYLLPELEARDYVYDFCELAENDVKLLVRRPRP
jgi:uncharacterized protein (DUF2249 family)